MVLIALRTLDNGLKMLLAVDGAARVGGVIHNDADCFIIDKSGKLHEVDLPVGFRLEERMNEWSVMQSWVVFCCAVVQRDRERARTSSG